MKKEFYEDYTMPEAKLTYQDGLEITIGCCYDNDDDPDYMPDYDVMFNKHISYTEFKLLADYLKDTIKPEDINLTYDEPGEDKTYTRVNIFLNHDVDQVAMNTMFIDVLAAIRCIFMCCDKCEITNF